MPQTVKVPALGRWTRRPSGVRAGFGAERFARLREVKRRYDPDNRFRFNDNIPLGDG